MKCVLSRDTVVAPQDPEGMRRRTHSVLVWTSSFLGVNGVWMDRWMDGWKSSRVDSRGTGGWVND